MRMLRLPPTRYGSVSQRSKPTAEELRHARGRVEEVDRVAGRRRVDDDQVVLARRVDLEQALHRDVVVTLHEARGEVGVQAVLEDAVRGRRVGRVPAHEVVPRLLRVEHRGPQLAARLDARGLQHLVRHPVRFVADAVEAERGREPAGGVDGEHERLAAEAGRGTERGRGRHRRLADTAGAAADHDLLGREELLERRRPRAARPRAQCPSSAPSASATMRVTRRP